MKSAIRSGLMSRSEAISAYGYDAEDVDREIATDNARADELGLVFDSDPRHELTSATAAGAGSGAGTAGSTSSAGSES